MDNHVDGRLTWNKIRSLQQRCIEECRKSSPLVKCWYSLGPAAYRIKSEFGELPSYEKEFDLLELGFPYESKFRELQFSQLSNYIRVEVPEPRSFWSKFTASHTVCETHLGPYYKTFSGILFMP